MQLPPKASPTLWLYMLWTFLDHGQLWSLCIRGQKFFESIFTPSNYLQRNWTKWRKEVSSLWIHILAPLAGRYSICYCVEDDKSNCRAGLSKSLYYCWYSCLTDFCSWQVCKIAKNIFCTVYVCQKFNFIPRSRILIETLHLDISLTVKLSG